MPESVTQGVRILGRVSGRPALLYGCQKAQGIIALESPAEKTVVQLADLDPRVARIKAQPFTVDVATGRLFHSREELLAARSTREKNEVKRREYTPDLLLVMLDGTMLVVEVKDERNMGDDEYWVKVRQAEKILRTNGYDFLVITIAYKPDHPLVQNADLLTSFIASYRGQLLPGPIAAAEQLLKDHPQELGTVCRHLEFNLRESPALLLSGLVRTNLAASRIAASSEVHLAYGDLTHLALLPLYPEVE